MLKTEPLLKAKNITTFYGENKILDALSFSLQPKEILMLVGANGAGKSTLLKVLFGIKQYSSGEILFAGEKIIPEVSAMVSRGIAFVPQDNRIFPEMSVEENIYIGAFSLNDKNLRAERFSQALRLFPNLKKKLKLSASSLSGGERQIVSLARSMMIQPKILFLDEPSVGLAPKVVSEVFAKIEEIHETYDTSIVVVEHNLKSLLKIADRALILAKGKIMKEGKPQELLASKILEEVFFGELA